MDVPNTYETEDADVAKTIRERLQSRLDETNLSPRRASLKAGLNEKFIKNFMEGSSKWPARENLEKIAQAVDCDFEYLLGNQPSPRGGQKASAGQGYLKLYRPEWKDIDPSGFFTLGEPEETIFSFLDSSGFAIAVPDNTNAPRLNPGEIAVTSARRALSNGAYVFVRKTDGHAAIGKLDDYQPEFVTLSGRVGRVDRENIALIHRIVGVFEA